MQVLPFITDVNAAKLVRSIVSLMLVSSQRVLQHKITAARYETFFLHASKAELDIFTLKDLVETESYKILLLQDFDHYGYYDICLHIAWVSYGIDSVPVAVGVDCRSHHAPPVL